MYSYKMVGERLYCDDNYLYSGRYSIVIAMIFAIVVRRLFTLR